MATLYELTVAEKQLIELFEDDEIDEQTLNDTVEGLDIGGKLEAYCKVVREFEADAKRFKEESIYFANKAKGAENGVKKLKNSILNYMKTTNKTKAEAGLFTVSTRESKAVNIYNETAIPIEYSTPQPPKIDKASIRKALMNGEKITGAELQINKTIQIK